jgi:hypothetical protein
MGVKYKDPTVIRENPDELPEIGERIPARDVLEHPRGVGEDKAVARKDGEVRPSFKVNVRRSGLGLNPRASSNIVGEMSTPTQRANTSARG